MRASHSAAERFQADPALGFARDAAQPEQAQRRLSQALNEDCELLGLRVLRVRAGRRALLRYDLHGARGPLSVIGKVRVRGLDTRTHQLQQALWVRGFSEASPDGLCVPEALGVVPGWHMTLQRFVEGPPLDLTSDPAQTGWVANLLNKLGAHHTLSVRRHTVHDELRILRTELGALAASRPRWRRRILEILDGCAALASRLPPGPERLIHRDCYGDQFIAGQRLTLLDLDLCCLGDPALDIGNMLAHLREAALRATGQALAARSAESALEQRFTALAGAGALQRARIYAVLSLARHVAISQRLPERRYVTPLVIEHCEHQLGMSSLVAAWAG